MSRDWSKKWVVWWALLSNSRTTKILFYHSESKNVHNRMLFEQWKEAALLWETLSVNLRISLYRTNSVYTWLDDDWTLRKKCNWYSLIEIVLLTQDVTECLYILQILWQMSYEQQLKESLTRLLKASICIEENLTKDIH